MNRKRDMNGGGFTVPQNELQLKIFFALIAIAFLIAIIWAIREYYYGRKIL